MSGPEDNPRDDMPIDQQEYKKWEAEQAASSPQIKKEWLAGFAAGRAELNAALALRTREAAELARPRGHNGVCLCDFCNRADTILALIKPDESAALDEHDRRVRLEEAEWWANFNHLNKDGSIVHHREKCVCCKRIVDLRWTGKEKQP